MTPEPIQVVVVDDDDLVRHGLVAMLEPHRDLIRVRDAAESMTSSPDIALVDTRGRGEEDLGRLTALLRNPAYGKVVVWTWNFQPWLAADATEAGAVGYLSKSLDSTELLNALVDIQAGKTVIAPSSAGGEQVWPGQDHGLTGRESEVLTLITRGHSNAEIAQITHLSINSIKSYIRSCYRKIDVSSRSQAVLWGVEHGLRGEHASMEIGSTE